MCLNLKRACRQGFNTRRSINVGLTLVQRRRRWTNVRPTLFQRLPSLTFFPCLIWIHYIGDWFRMDTIMRTSASSQSVVCATQTSGTYRTLTARVHKIIMCVQLIGIILCSSTSHFGRRRSIFNVYKIENLNSSPVLTCSGSPKVRLYDGIIGEI